MVNLEYGCGKDGLVKYFRVSLICYGHNPNDHDRVLGYDTKHQETLGPCHRHHKDADTPEPLQDCRFTEILSEFCQEAREMSRALGCPGPSEDVWKSSCG
ncbi:MAG: hypothetical protein ACYCSS_15335 [Sulfuriferula sp.]